MFLNLLVMNIFFIQIMFSVFTIAVAQEIPKVQVDVTNLNVKANSITLPEGFSKAQTGDISITLCEDCNPPKGELSFSKNDDPQSENFGKTVVEGIIYLPKKVYFPDLEHEETIVTAGVLIEDSGISNQFEMVDVGAIITGNGIIIIICRHYFRLRLVQEIPVVGSVVVDGSFETALPTINEDIFIDATNKSWELFKERNPNVSEPLLPPTQTLKERNPNVSEPLLPSTQILRDFLESTDQIMFYFVDSKESRTTRIKNESAFSFSFTKVSPEQGGNKVPIYSKKSLFILVFSLLVIGTFFIKNQININKKRV